MVSARNNLDVSAYFVVGPENTKGRPVGEIIKAVIEARYTCLQIRSKNATTSELIALAREAADIIADANRSDAVALLINDRLDVILAARAFGIKVDGIHIGQLDMPVEVCRRYLGEDSIVGLSARSHDMLDYIQTTDVGEIDYFGVGPLRETQTKPDCGLGLDGEVLTMSFDDISTLANISSIPVVVGGGVKLFDIPSLARTGADGFFVVSAISEADNPRAEAAKLIEAWKENFRPKSLHKRL